LNTRSVLKLGEGTGKADSDMLGLSRHGMETGQILSRESASAEPEQVPSKKQKADPILPASKWNREDDSDDYDDRKDGQGLGLSYSSGSDNAGDSGKADTTEISTDHLIHHPDTIVDEEHRYPLNV
jgi:U2-associated protein SR140